MRKSSSYYENLVALNKKLAAAKKPPVVVNKRTADFWKQVFPHIAVHDAVVVHSGGEIAWAIRKNTPQLKAALDEFAKHNKVGTSIGNQLLKRYLKDVKYVKNAASDEEWKKLQALVEYFKKYGDQYDVEYVAAERARQETVTYVSNIYKYFIAYSLVMKIRAAKKEAVEKIKAETD